MGGGEHLWVWGGTWGPGRAFEGLRKHLGVQEGSYVGWGCQLGVWGLHLWVEFAGGGSGLVIIRAGLRGRGRGSGKGEGL